MNEKLQPIIQKVTKLVYAERVIILIVAAGIAVGIAVFSASTYNGDGKDDTRYNEGSTALKRFKFDENAITQIRTLQGGDFNIQPSLTSNRTNPFSQ